MSRMSRVLTTIDGFIDILLYGDVVWWLVMGRWKGSVCVGAGCYWIYRSRTRLGGELTGLRMGGRDGGEVRRYISNRGDTTSVAVTGCASVMFRSP